MKAKSKSTQAVAVKASAETVENANATVQPALVKREVINKVALIGHTGNDPEITTFASGMKKAKFRVATNRYYKDAQGEWKSETTWHNVVAWSDLAIIAEQQLKKGTALSIDGRLAYRMFQDKNGKERFYTEIVASTIVAIPAKQKEETSLNIAA